jgi:hypothetical protein
MSFIRSKIPHLNLGERFYKVIYTVKNPSLKFRRGILQSLFHGQKSLT